MRAALENEKYLEYIVSFVCEVIKKATIEYDKHLIYCIFIGIMVYSCLYFDLEVKGTIKLFHFLDTITIYYIKHFTGILKFPFINRGN